MRRVRGRSGATFYRLAPLIGALMFSAQPEAKQEGVRPERACAAYDLHWITLIEDHGRAQEMGADEIYRAFLTILEARLECRVGNFDRALQLYSDVPIPAPGVAPNHWVLLR